MTVSSLRALTRRALAARAKKHQIAGWHEMTKDELVAALAACFRRRSTRGEPSGSARTRSDARSNGRSHRPVQRAIGGGGHLNGRRLLKPAENGIAPHAACDALVAEVRDPCWIHVRWSLSRHTLARAEAAMGAQWHCAVPVLRIFDVTGDDAGTSPQTRVRDIDIHGDVDHWYVPVENPPRTYKVQIGYRAPSGGFFVMAQSNRVQTPQPGSHSLQARENGRLRAAARAAGAPIVLEKRPIYDLRALPTAKQRNGRESGGSTAAEDGELPQAQPVELRLHAELILHGMTDPQAELKVLGDHVPVSRDGTFSQRFSLPDGRQVIDAVVTTRNGSHQRTIVLGIERNTKELEPQWFDEINR